MKRSYKIDPIIVNGVRIVEVVIDSHYEKKHSRYMDDAIIVELVKELDGRHEVPQEKHGPYAYFATLIERGTRQYRLIWLLEEHAIYIGVVNAYRDRRRK